MVSQNSAMAGMLALFLIAPGPVKAVEEWFQKGLSLSRAGQYEEAMEAFSKAIEAQPDRAEACNNRGALRYQQKDYAGAIEDYSQAIALQPLADFYNNRGAAWYRLGPPSPEKGSGGGSFPRPTST